MKYYEDIIRYCLDHWYVGSIIEIFITTVFDPFKTYSLLCGASSRASYNLDAWISASRFRIRVDNPGISKRKYIPKERKNGGMFSFIFI